MFVDLATKIRGFELKKEMLYLGISERERERFYKDFLHKEYMREIIFIFIMKCIKRFMFL